MNFKKLAKNLGLEEDEFLEFVELFVEVGTSDLDKLQTAIAEGSAESAANAAHSLKGAAGNLGLIELYEIAKEIEEKARNEILDGTIDAVRIIKEKLDLIMKTLKARHGT